MSAHGETIAHVPVSAGTGAALSKSLGATHSDRALPRREAAKERRRQQILEAARALIEESGETGLSMRSLAERARVSTATPYNLFGSKHGVLTALLDADLRRYQRRLKRSDGDTLDLVFNAISVAREFFEREPEFYRAVLGAVYVAGADYRTLFGEPRRAFWRWLVERAIAEDIISRRIRAPDFAANLVMIFFCSIMEWVSGAISLIEMEMRVDYGIALSLLAIAQPQYRERLESRLYEAQGRLEAL